MLDKNNNSPHNKITNLQYQIEEMQFQIEKLKSNEQILNITKEKYTKVFQSIPDSISLSKINDGRIIEFNQGFIKTFGYTRDEAIGKTSLELNIWLSEKERTFVVAQLNQKGFIRDKEVSFRKKSGEIRFGKIFMEKIEINNDIFIITMVYDITEQKMNQEQVKMTSEQLKTEREALKEKNIALEQILTHIEKEKENYREELCTKVENLLLPLVKKLQQNNGYTNNPDLFLLEKHISSIISKNIDQFKINYSKLTPRELDICEGIKKGMTSKEMAEKFFISLETVHKHRNSIRNKLQITNNDINLSSYLRSN